MKGPETIAEALRTLAGCRDDGERRDIPVALDSALVADGLDVDEATMHAPAGE